MKGIDYATFIIFEDVYQEFVDNEITIAEFINEVIDDGPSEFESNADRIRGQLCSLHSSDGGSPSVDDYKIEDITYDPATKKGVLYFSYQVHYYFGCSDMDNEVHAEEQCNFTINEEKLELVIEFKEPAVRDTFEEF